MNDNKDQDHPEVLLFAGVCALGLGLCAILIAESFTLHRLLNELKWIAEVVR